MKAGHNQQENSMAKKTTKKAASKTTGRKSTRKAAKSAKSTRTAAKSTRTATKRTRKAAAKRELIDTGTDKRYVRRGVRGQFKESDDVGRSLSIDRRKKAKTKVKSGQGDRGDQ
jgi:hypothetical protein